MGINGPWITKSYLELILERKGWELDFFFFFFVFVFLPMFLRVHIYFLFLFNGSCEVSHGPKGYTARGSDGDTKHKPQITCV